MPSQGNRIILDKVLFESLYGALRREEGCHFFHSRGVRIIVNRFLFESFFEAFRKGGVSCFDLSGRSNNFLQIFLRVLFFGALRMVGDAGVSFVPSRGVGIVFGGF